MLLATDEVQEALEWLHNRIEPWIFVSNKWALTCQIRHATLKSNTASENVADYFDEYKVLKQPLGYALVSE